jgi:hypothetical protein
MAVLLFYNIMLLEGCSVVTERYFIQLCSLPVGYLYEAYSESKYHLRIFLLQRRGRDFAHAHCFPSFISKPQTPMREKQVVFTYCSVCLKCSR